MNQQSEEKRNIVSVDMELVSRVVSESVNAALKALQAEIENNVATNEGIQHQHAQSVDDFVASGLPTLDLPTPPAKLFREPNQELESIELTAPQLIEVRGSEAPWILKAKEYIDKQEIDHNAELQAFLGIDPAKIAWCAYFVKAVLTACVLPTLNSGRAADWVHYGTECGKVPGAIAVFDAGNVPGGHVGFITEGDKILGGNQGDMVRYNNLGWYLDNKRLLGYRCPPGYALV